MSDALKTSDVSAPPSIALAMMAAELARHRTGGFLSTFVPNMGDTPCPREFADRADHTATRHYYAILDRISRGEQP